MSVDEEAVFDLREDGARRPLTKWRTGRPLATRGAGEHRDAGAVVAGLALEADDCAVAAGGAAAEDGADGVRRVGQRRAGRGEANGQLLPLAVLAAADGVGGQAGGEGEAGVALVRRHAAVSHVGGGDRKSVVDLRHGAAVALLAVRDVRHRPLAALQAFGSYLHLAVVELLPSGAREGDVGAEGGATARRQCVSANLERRTVGAEAGRPACSRVESVALEDDQHLARRRRQRQRRRFGLGAEAASGMERHGGANVGAVKDLERVVEGDVERGELDRQRAAGRPQQSVDAVLVGRVVRDAEGGRRDVAGVGHVLDLAAGAEADGEAAARVAEAGLEVEVGAVGGGDDVARVGARRSGEAGQQRVGRPGPVAHVDVVLVVLHLELGHLQCQRLAGRRRHEVDALEAAGVGLGVEGRRDDLRGLVREQLAAALDRLRLPGGAEAALLDRGVRAELDDHEVGAGREHARRQVLVARQRRQRHARLLRATARQDLHRVEVGFRVEFRELQHHAGADRALQRPLAVAVGVVAARVVGRDHLVARTLQVEVALARAVHLVRLVAAVVVPVAPPGIVDALAVAAVR